MNIIDRKKAKAAKLISSNPDIQMWAKLYTESLTEDELKESTSDEDILNTVFSALLYFLAGEGNKVLKDDEWMQYLINDINSAIANGLFKPQFEDKQHIKKIQDIQFGENEVVEDSETNSEED